MAGRAIRLRRVYDEPAPEDGTRVLVDRLWPRGVGKDTDRFDAWVKEAAPSSALRRWYGHEPGRSAEFRDRYLREMQAPAGRQAVAGLRDLAAGQPVTLLTATKDIGLSHLPVLAELIEGDR